MAKIQAHVYISGRVQGVFFRDSTRSEAIKLGLNGWVKNLRDGRVEAIFEGEEEKVKKMIEWCKKGPVFARVSGVEVEFGEFTGKFNEFEIRYD